MFDKKKFLLKIKPLLFKMSKKSGVFAKNLIKKAKETKISKEKIKKIINVLDESKPTRTWIRVGLVLILGGLIAKKVLDVYDEEKTFKENMKDLGKYIKKLKKRIQNHGC